MSPRRSRSPWGAGAGTVLVAALLLTGCGGGDEGADGGGSDAGTSTSAPGASTPPPTPSASTPPPPTPSPSVSAPSDSAPAPAGEGLVTVTVSGGIDGRHQSMFINRDGSYTTSSHRPSRPERQGRMKPAELAALRTALAEADFAKLPRRNLADRPVPDGLTTVLVYAGHQVATADGAKPIPALNRVIAALPPMDTGT
ncbi:MAG TPA: hypothetical protein VFH94_24635 [Streptomyces sp.]|nr:hypothetical protein [Streptomyces sp.]